MNNRDNDTQLDNLDRCIAEVVPTMPPEHVFYSQMKNFHRTVLG